MKFNEHYLLGLKVRLKKLDKKIESFGKRFPKSLHLAAMKKKRENLFLKYVKKRMFGD